MQPCGGGGGGVGVGASDNTKYCALDLEDGTFLGYVHQQWLLHLCVLSEDVVVDAR